MIRYIIWPPVDRDRHNEDSWCIDRVERESQKVGLDLDYDPSDVNNIRYHHRAWWRIVDYYLNDYHIRHKHITVTVAHQITSTVTSATTISINPGFKIYLSKEDLTLLVLGLSDIPFIYLDDIQTMRRNLSSYRLETCVTFTDIQ